MIAKRIRREKGTSSFKRLSAYVMNAENGGKGDPADWNLAEYILDNEHAGEKVAYIRVTNCGAADPGMATKEILATQQRNKRSHADKSYHLVISFPEGEKPTREQIEDIEDAAVKAIGLQEHQRISAIHQNTSNWHLHVAISKINPITLRAIEPYYDHLKLQEVCREMEIKHGLTRDNHTPAPEKSLTGGASEMEAHAERVSFIRWVQEHVAADLVQALGTPPEADSSPPSSPIPPPFLPAEDGPLGSQPPPPDGEDSTGEAISPAPPPPDAQPPEEVPSIQTWADLHALLADRGLVIQPRGAGLIVAHSRDPKVRMKASDVDRSLSMKALTDRLGPYVPPTPGIGPATPTIQYDGGPIDATPEVDDLWKRFCVERDDARRAAKHAMTKLRTNHLSYTTELRHWYGERYKAAKAARLNRGDRIATYQALSDQRRQDAVTRKAREKAERQQCKAVHPIPTWLGFLEHELRNGNMAALEPLERIAARTEILSISIVSEPTIGHSPSVSAEVRTPDVGSSRGF